MNENMTCENEMKHTVPENATTKEDRVIGSALRKYEREARARGEILNPFIKQHLEAKIFAARLTLALSMAMTFLFKGQWILWIIFIIQYNVYVAKENAKALEEDLKRGKK